MVAVASVAVAAGFNGVDWTASAADRRLMSFYEAVGAVRDPNRCFFRLASDALVGLSGTGSRLSMDPAPSATPR